MSKLCVRCGRGPRVESTYLCLACILDPASRYEVAEALKLDDPLKARRHVIERFHWVGGWGRDARA